MSWNHSLLLQVKQQPHSYSQYVVGSSRATSAMKPLTCWSTSSPASRYPSSLVLASSAIVSCSFSYINKQDLPLCLCYQQRFHYSRQSTERFIIFCCYSQYLTWQRKACAIISIHEISFSDLSDIFFYNIRSVSILSSQGSSKKIEIKRFFYKCKSGTKL